MKTLLQERKDEIAASIASQAAGYRHVYEVKSGRNQIAAKARRAKRTPEEVEADTVLFELEHGALWGKNTPRLQRVVLKALERRDARFFKNLGRIFQRGPTSIWLRTGPAERFLLANWTEALGGWPALHSLTDADLTQVCIQEINQANLTRAAVIKMRQRLGLKPLSAKRVAIWKAGQITGFEAEAKEVDKTES